VVVLSKDVRWREYDGRWRVRTEYLRRSWKALTGNEHWWKTVLILALVQVVPVIGPIIVLGYLFQWARDAAWGVERGLPKSTSGLSQAVKTGSIAFLMLFCLGLIFMAVNYLLSIVPYTGNALSVMAIPLLFACGLFASVMLMRATIYDSMEPCVQISQAWEMVEKDPIGLLKVFGIYCLSFLGILMIAPGALVLLILNLVGITGTASFLVIMLCALPLAFLCQTIALVFFALSLRALGYWTAGFSPSTWGTSSQGLGGCHGRTEPGI